MSKQIVETIKLVQELHSDAVASGASHATKSHLERILPILQAGAKREVEIEEKLQSSLAKSQDRIQAEIDKASGALKEKLEKLNQYADNKTPERAPDFMPDFSMDMKKG